MNHKEIRRTFLDFYARRGHTIVPSSSLIPKDDPTLLWTSAGMVQFKPLFAGTVPLPYKRATSIQKCLRATDLDKVGFSIKYNTFFEMLGNFSFGDYFKKEAIPWAWEYLVEIVKLPVERLSVSVFEADEEAYNIWSKDVGLEEEKIYRLGEKDNFWGPAGGVGACGPCSEIYFDMGEEFSCGKSTCAPGCDCERFVEVYNIVFPQFDQQPDGSRLPLKNRGIDTGMGMERLAMVSQGKKSIFETDLFLPIIKATQKVLESEMNEVNKPLFYVTADHSRALTFAIADGAIPSNEARGYILRSILRRGSLIANRYGIERPFLYQISGEVIEVMRQFYPELALPGKREEIALIIKSEEERFLRTLSSGLERFDELLSRYQETKIIPGEEVFRLHDTFGFPFELTKELAQEKGYLLDVEGFEKAMAQQREQSKKVLEVVGETEAPGKIKIEDTVEGKFVGYETTELKDTELLHFEKIDDDTFEVILEETVFYPESGGQIGDTGSIISDDFELSVLDTYYKPKTKTVASKVKVLKGEIKTGIVTAIVDLKRRMEISRAHTATHILHSGLRNILGETVRQEGSLVEPGRLRFDFLFYRPLTDDEIFKVEELCNQKVIEDIELKIFKDISLKEAQAMGALAFFTEEYGERVRVIEIPGFSIELCAGTHLKRTGEIGLLKITSETGIAAGIRRIEALVGERAYKEINNYYNYLAELQKRLDNAPFHLLSKKIDETLSERKILENRLSIVTAHYANLVVEKLLAESLTIQEVKVIIGDFNYLNLEELRLISDRIRQRLKGEKFVGCLFSTLEPRLRYIIFLSEELNQASGLIAEKLAKEVGKVIEGGGGGKVLLAEGGGKKEKITDGINRFKELIQSSIQNQI